MGDWTLKNKWMAGTTDQLTARDTLWMFRFVNDDTGQEIEVMAYDEDEAGQKIADGDFDMEDED